MIVNEKKVYNSPDLGLSSVEPNIFCSSLNGFGLEAIDSSDPIYETESL